MWDNWNDSLLEHEDCDYYKTYERRQEEEEAWRDHADDAYEEMLSLRDLMEEAYE